MSVDEFIRGAAITLAAYDMVLIPVLVWRRTAHRRIAWCEVAVVAGIDLLLLGRLVHAVTRWHQELVWWGSPVTFAGTVCLAVAAQAVLKRIA